MIATMRIWIVVLAFVLALPGQPKAQTSPRVHLGQQELSGVMEGNGVASFRGIAYARPPVGALRWKAPQLPIARKGRIDATRFAAACAQGPGNTRWYRRVAAAMGARPAAVKEIGPVSEDCLYLNVWTPQPGTRAPQGRLPVMVWIHGGSNENGYAHEPNYLGSRLARQGMVVVSINYRVGLLGFMAHPALGADATGRQGLLDQLAALRWIGANIAQFGGDPSRVTLFGESAGGTNIAVLAAMPEARGLFAQAILQSGYVPPDAVMTQNAASKLAISVFGKNANARSLRAVPWQQIVALQEQKLPGHFYAPVASLPDGLSVPLLIGSNANELLMYLSKDRAAQEAEFSRELATLAPDRAAGASALLENWPGGLAGRLDTLSSGKAFHCPLRRLADAAANSGQTAFVYYFERVRPGDHGLGAYHGAEIPYVFNSDDAWLQGDDQDRDLSRAMLTYWANFARSGDPNGPGLPIWPRWEGASQLVLALGDAVQPKLDPHARLCDLL